MYRFKRKIAVLTYPIRENSYELIEINLFLLETHYFYHIYFTNLFQEESVSFKLLQQKKIIKFWKKNFNKI